MTKKTANRFSPEVRQWAVRMVLDHGGDHASQWAAIGSVAAKIGCTAETLRKRVRPAECDQDQRPGAMTEEDYFCHVFRDIADAAGLPADLHFRDLRATAITELADAGATDIQMGTHSGHLTADMRRRYAQRTPEQFEGAAKLRLAQERKGRKG